MKTITLEEAINLLVECAAVITDDYALMYPIVGEGDDEEELAILNWEDEGEEYLYVFNKCDNHSIEVEGTSMFLIDVEGASIQLTLLTGMNLD